ncbi:MAG: hypothetical protein A2W91_05535 [Bacteroidetes bacterium GWF2_38_335]|nr:MAG: hypothetical protein A2W91_05535 [Bacteroidetes bacterium GWF2_38_335]HBS88094.1 hypothetical protein [Bacteroidales bacterium]
MNWLKKYLEEKKGVDSLIRLQSLLTLIFSFVMIIWQMAQGKIYIELDILLITACFAPKALQKFAEAKMYNKEDDNEQ